jgi:hypothetical protein
MTMLERCARAIEAVPITDLECGNSSLLRFLADEIERKAIVRAVLTELPDPDEAWDGLPRQIMMWMDFGERTTPRSLFAHLERSGYEIPQWLRDEPEMQHLDHVPSKGTRCVLIWKAMLANILKEGEG